MQLGGRSAEEKVCQEGHGPSDVGHQHGRDIHIVVQRLADIADSSAFGGIRQIFLAESGTLADEEGTRGNLFGIIGQAADDGVLDLGELSLDQKVRLTQTAGIGFKRVLFHGLGLLTIVFFEILLLMVLFFVRND